MEKVKKNIKYAFNPKSIAVIGASRHPEKLGAVIVKNLISGGYQGKIYPINPKYDEVQGLPCYSSVKDVRGRVECAIIAVPAKVVPKVLRECAEKGVKSAVVLSGGFGEVGEKQLEKEIVKICKEGKIALVGPNCLGTMNASTKVDSIFMPFHKLERPRSGNVSFITQSGGVGSVLIDLAAYYGVGVGKFVSYGNASLLDESDFLEYFGKDKETKVIVLYIEGTKNGRKLYETMKKVIVKKPIIVLKGGKTTKAKEAAFSHTGNLAGNYLAYRAAFRGAKVIESENLEEVFDFLKIFNQPLPKGKRIGIITNGGGLGVLTADAAEREKMEIPSLTEDSKEKLKEILPPYANISNPLDLVADATTSTYEKAIEIMMNDENIDSLIINVLFQLPTLDDNLLNVLIRASEDKRKPIAVVAVGGEHTHMQRKILESNNVPTYESPNAAVKALKKLSDYSLFLLNTKKR